jgi:hypothetical protein
MTALLPGDFREPYSGKKTAGDVIVFISKQKRPGDLSITGARK